MIKCSSWCNRSKVVMSDRVHRNCFRCSDAESDEHILAKLSIFRFLRRNCLDCITEARFVRGGRADLYCLSLDVAIEVVSSEKLGSIVLKQCKYPCEVLVFDVNKFNTKDKLLIWCVDNLL